jgi:transporter family-2 protein
MRRLPHVPGPIAALLAVFVGVLVAVQSRINGQLAIYVHGDGVYSAAVALSVGLTIIVVGMALMPSSRHAVAELPGLVRTGVLRPWELFGGLGGASLVAAQGIVVPRAGVAPFTVSTVAGQTANSVLVDQLGLAPGGKRHVTWQRIVAAVLATSAVGIAVLGRGHGNSVSLFLILLPIIAGALTAVQQAFNSRVAVTTGSTWAATFMNFIVAAGALWSAVGIEHVINGKPLATLPPVAEAWLYLGGPLGVTFIAIAALIVGRLGVLIFGLASILGQLVGAVVIDASYPTPGAVVGPQTVIAIGVTACAVALASLSARAATTTAGSAK